MRSGWSGLVAGRRNFKIALQRKSSMYRNIYAELKIVGEDLVPNVEVVFDGADQIDKKSNMIKGGGGALLKEKILHSAAKNVIITAESTKYVESFNRSVPLEVHPFARYLVAKKLEELCGRPKLRTSPRIMIRPFNPLFFGVRPC